jgi:subtilisin family serine protease
MVRALLALGVVLVLSAPAAGLGAAPASVEARLVVGTGSPAQARAVASRIRSAGGRVDPIPRIGGMEVFTDDPAALRRLLRGDPRVDFLEPVLMRHLSAEPSETIDTDTGRPFDWAYDAVKAGGGIAAMGGGSSVGVAVLDSGVDVTHPDLSGRVGPGVDIQNGGTTVTDTVGHGTFIAGLIAAIDGNGIGGRGVAGATPITPVRLTTNENISSAAAAAGIVWAADHGARVLNLSFGGPGLSEIESSALDYARQKDVLVVAAAGNNANAGTNPNQPQYPAAAIGGTGGGWSSGLSVGATMPSGLPAAFSTFNDGVSLVAPGAGDAGSCGDGVFSTVPGNTNLIWDGGNACTPTFGAIGNPDGRYGYGEGTSFSTPIVAGAAALVRGANTRLTAEQTGDVLRRSAHQTVGTGWNQKTGAGIVDITAAVALARRYDTTPPAPALAVVGEPASISVSLGGTDVSHAGGDLAGVASYALEHSRDGATYTPLVAAQATPVKARESISAQEKWWYRGTLCDANHNCASVVKGPAGAGTPASLLFRPAVKRLAVTRPGRCPGRARACLRISFGASAPSPSTWTVIVKQTGTKRVLARRSARVRAGARVTRVVNLPPKIACARRLTVTIRVRGAAGGTETVRRLPRGRACRIPS